MSEFHVKKRRTKIYKAYGKDSIGIVKENPYRLAYDIYGIGFLTADKIAEKLDFEKDSPLRAEAGLLYALHELSDEGHVYYPTENLFEVASDLLKIEADLVLRSARDRLNEEKRIVTELIRIDGGHMSVTYLAGYHLAEVQAASRLRILSRALSSLRPVKVDAAIGWAEEKSGLKLAKRQKEAVASALTGGVGYGAFFKS